MVEANPVKYYLAKFIFLGFGIVQWILAAVLLLRFDFNSKNFFVSLLFITLGAILFGVFFFLNDKIKRVAVGKKKIVVIEGDRNMRFEWPDVKSLELVPYFNIYKMKVKGKRGPIYFFPSANIDPTFGLMMKDTSRMGEIVEKRKKEFNIK